MIAERDNPELWEQLRQEALASDKYGIAGQWNARKASAAVVKYKQSGGGYTGEAPSPKNNKLKKWLSEDWRTYDGSPAIQYDVDGTTVQTKRYLPAKAWEQLSPQQVGATNRLKSKAAKEGKQFVSNAPAAKEASRQAREFSYMARIINFSG